MHRVTNVIGKAPEERKICSAVFLDVVQALDKVWHDGLLLKLREIFPVQYYLLLESYIKERYFIIKQEEAYSELKEIGAGVPQGSVLTPVLYLLYTRDIPNEKNTVVAMYADDTAILSLGSSTEEATNCKEQ